MTAENGVYLASSRLSIGRTMSQSTSIGVLFFFLVFRSVAVINMISATHFFFP